MTDIDERLAELRANAKLDERLEQLRNGTGEEPKDEIRMLITKGAGQDADVFLEMARRELGIADDVDDGDVLVAALRKLAQTF